MPAYAELHCASNFSFLRAASHPDELVERAAALGYRALAVTDRNSLAGVVRAHVAAKECGLKLLIGAEVELADAPSVVLLAMDRGGYGRLCRLLTTGRMRVPKGECYLSFADLAGHAEGLIAVALPSDGVADDVESCGRSLARYREVFWDRAYLAAELSLGPDDAKRLAWLEALSRRSGLKLVAANDVRYHAPERRFLHDVLRCIDLGCTIEQAGRRLTPNAERYLKEPAAMARLFADCREAIARTVEIADHCSFSLDELRYEYPEGLCPPGARPMAYLAELTWAGARRRYPEGVPQKVRDQIEHELQLIEQLGYEAYFLTVWDVVRFARSRGILCQGRGSAANSAVCYCLGITAVDPGRIDVLFERFVSRERNEPPDIDVDFEHERREEVFQYIYGKYGRDHAAIAAEVITYRGRLAVREVGKALGLSLDRVDAIAKAVDSWGDESVLEQRLCEVGLDPDQRTLRCLVRLVRQIIGFPRHLSQHVGGFVISRGSLCDLVPIANAAMPDRTFIEWDKNDIDALGILKVDCLALGMLTALHKCFDFLREYHGVRMGLADVPAEDASVYRMIQRADTVGVFQIESRAQMSMLPRLRPACFYDLVIEVAIVRPGPIQGDMVHPYLRRRKGLEAETYPNEAIRAVLGKTLGVPLFQEQAMRLAMVAAGFGPGQADALRRAMGAWRKRGLLEKFRQQLLEGMRRNGLPEAFARRTFEQICGFGEYGFPESHAASFALLVYVSAWLKRYWPAAYCAALMNSQPMGFYAPAQLVQDAKRHGVAVRPVDVNFSGYDCRLEGNVSAKPAGADDRPETWGGHGPAIRLGMRLVRGLSAEQAVRIERARQEGRFGSVGELARRTGIGRAGLAKLAAADAFGSMGLDRRQAMWQVLRQGEVLPLLAGLDDEEPVAPLPDEPCEQAVAYDYHHVGLSLKVHPMALRREELARRGVVAASRLAELRSGGRVAVAGLVTVRQRPSTAKGIVFMTLEDETGVANLLVRPEVYERYRKVARSATGMLAAGKLERSDGVVHVVVDRMVDLADGLGALTAGSRDFR